MNYKKWKEKQNDYSRKLGSQKILSQNSFFTKEHTGKIWLVKTQWLI